MIVYLCDRSDVVMHMLVDVDAVGCLMLLPPAIYAVYFEQNYNYGYDSGFANIIVSRTI
jgi:hypothetical protein